MAIAIIYYRILTHKLLDLTTNLAQQYNNRKLQAIFAQHTQVFFAFGYQITEFRACTALAHEHQYLG